MKLAYLILAHKNPEQLQLLVDALSSADTYIFVHIDKKIGLNPFKVRFSSLGYPNLFFCENRVQVTWGGFGMIKATVALINLLLEKEIDFDYASLISGQDYPIKSNNEILNFLEKNYGHNFIENYPLYNRTLQDFDNGLYRIQNWFWVEKLGVSNSIRLHEIQRKLRIKRKYLKGIVPYWGSQWWTLHKDCILFLHQQCHHNNRIFSYYRNTYIPDEMLFQTMIMNSSFKGTIINDNLRYVEWLSYPFTSSVMYCKTLTISDVRELVNTSRLFARKLDNRVDMTIFKYIDISRNKDYFRKLKSCDS